MGRGISEGIRGAVTGDGVNGVSNMLYADDLSSTFNDPGGMQVVLNRVLAYAIRKGLTVNTSKSEVMHLNNVDIPEKEQKRKKRKKQFKYLGMLVDKRMNLKVSEENAVRPYMAAQQRIKEFVYDTPAGMYACQVWGTDYLQEGSVKSSATNWPVLRECGQDPL
eukprot:1152152-Pelagomonas_calceolata.AAC.1